MGEFYRFELKYLITDNEIPIIQECLKYLMDIDPHAKKGIYRISSLYFDDPDQSSFYDVEDGMDLKKKYRIRIYDGSSDLIRLECKKKKESRALKRSCLLSQEQLEELRKGNYLRDLNGQDELLKQFSAEIMTKRLHPVIIVEYDRIPYVYPAGNVRITLDTNIVSSTDLEHFPGEVRFRQPILPAGTQLLEVKYDAFLPDHIRDVFTDLDLKQISFSKYSLCRRYNVRGGSLL